MQLGSLPGSHAVVPLAVWTPTDELVSSHWIVHAPAFAEEMNKSRHMVARQARRFAARGYTVVVPDLCGTGDSPSSFEDATWEGWIDELCRVVEWARRQGAEAISLWGLRLGCLLAVAAAARLAGEGRAPSHLLLWQPLLAGKVQMAQFLRLVTAASITSSGKGASAAEVKAALAAGQSVEVAGYPLSSALYANLQAAEALALTLSVDTRVSVLEIVAEHDKPLLPVTGKQVAAWQAQGVDCSAQTVIGDPFWATQELGFADALLEASDSAVASLAVARPDPAKSAHPKLDLSVLGEDVASERPLVFSCQGAQLAGCLYEPLGVPRKATGMVIVVGGPQYRVGSHRQFVSLARAVARAGFPVLRFDYRGMGDSDGELLGFTGVHDDIRAAVDALQEACPGVKRTVLWGLCDAATAAVAYAGSDSRVGGLVLANPWVYSEQGAASVKVRSYYARRLVSADFWKKFFAGGVPLLSSVREFSGVVARAVGVGVGKGGGKKRGAERNESTGIKPTDLVNSFSISLKASPIPALFLLSERDFTASEFKRAVERSPALRNQVEASQREVKHLKVADHTFSNSRWQSEVEDLSVAFLRSL